jgi:hypothetical protein
VGIGTSSPGAKLHVVGTSGAGAVQIGTSAGANEYQYITFGGGAGGTDFGWQIGRSSNTSGIGGDGAFYFYDIKANANRMSIDSSGNLGLGVTPSAWGATVISAIQVGNKGSHFASWTASQSNDPHLFLGNNAYWNGTNWLYSVSPDRASVQYRQYLGQHEWYNAPSGTAGNAISFTQVMTVSSDGTFRVKGAGTAGSTDAFQVSGSAPASAMVLNSSGNVGIGVTNPSVALVVAFATDGIIGNYFSSTGNNSRISFSNAGLLNNNVSIGSASDAMVMYTGATERARITSTGNVVAGGSVALATTATDGFLYVPTCAGTPTGVPTAITGMAPIVVNTTNNKLYFYSGGAWRDAGP